VLTRSRDAAPDTGDDRFEIAAVRGAFCGRVRLAGAILRLHRRRPVDLVTTQTVYDEAWLALLIGRLLGIPVVGQIHFDVFSPVALRDALGTSPLARLRSALLFRGLKYFSGLRCVAEATAAAVRERVPRARVCTIPVPVDMVRAPADVPESRKRSVLFVGRLAEQKNLFRWLDAAAAVRRAEPDVTFDIVGDGPLRTPLMAHANRLALGPNVRFHGALGHDSIKPLYASASLLLMTSKYEGFGRVVVEAAAHATPTVATAATGLTEIIEDGTSGILIGTDEPSDVAAATLRVLRNPSMGRSLGAAARDRVTSRYDPRDLAREWVGFLAGFARPEPTWLLTPRRRTLARWRRVACSKLTILRALEYEALEGLRLAGRTLDIGGGEETSYNGLLRIEGRFTTVNLTSRIRPTVQADVNAGLPFAAGVFDNVISLNTLEHVRLDEQVVGEAVRVLKPGGTLHLIVPFLYQVHGSPSDYHRHTCFWWHETLAALGIAERNLIVEPLVWDRLSSAYSFVGHGRLGVLLKRAVMMPAVIRDALRREPGRLRSDREAASAQAVALGYYIRATKAHHV
jgi:glycosyltransferase involved in cell wall biosynthesis